MLSKNISKITFCCFDFFFFLSFGAKRSSRTWSSLSSPTNFANFLTNRSFKVAELFKPFILESSFFENWCWKVGYKLEYSQLRSLGTLKFSKFCWRITQSSKQSGRLEQSESGTMLTETFFVLVSTLCLRGPFLLHGLISAYIWNGMLPYENSLKGSRHYCKYSFWIFLMYLEMSRSFLLLSSVNVSLHRESLGKSYIYWSTIWLLQLSDSVEYIINSEVTIWLFLVIRPFTSLITGLAKIFIKIHNRK